MSYELVMLDTAKQDLRKIINSILEVSKSKDITKKIVTELKDKYDYIKDFPLAGSLPRDRILIANGYRFVIFNDYLSFYTIDNSKKIIYIHAIINSKTDYMKTMKKYI